MIAALLSKLPIDKAADWGFGVSICIAVMAEGTGAIICVSDEKADFGDFAADNIGDKEDLISYDCLVMCAGNDAEYAPMVLESAKSKLSGKIWTPEVAAECIKVSYHELLQKQITEKVLARYGLDSEKFLNRGREIFTPAIFTRLCSQIESIKLSLRFLVCGYERNPKNENQCKAHIYEIPDTDTINCRDSIGMWAIGSGKYLAMSSLTFAAHRRGLSKKSKLLEAIYCALEAKFMAESNGLVGETTNVGIITPTSLGTLSSRHVDTIRKAWKKAGAPRIPRGALQTIEKRLSTLKWKSTASRADLMALHEEMTWSVAKPVTTRASNLAEYGDIEPKPSASEKSEQGQ